MATNITNIDPTLNSAGDIISLSLSGDSDRTRIQVQISSPTNGAFFALQQVLPDPASGDWSMVFQVFAGDVNCSEDIDIDVLWFDQPTSTWTQEDNYPITQQIDCSGAAQCLISILSLEGIEAPAGQTGMSEVIVTGTASSCSQVDVTVFDVNNGPNPIVASAIVLNGSWEAHFVRGAAGVETRIKAYQCKEDHTIRAECSADPGCFAEGVFELQCAPDCPDFADVQVQNASGTLQVTNPVAGELQCLPAGRYSVGVISPADADVSSYTWYRNQNEANPIGNARILDIDLGDQENVSYTVAIDMVNGCSPARTVVFSCGGPENPPPPPPPDPGEEENGNGNGGNGNGNGNGENGNGGVCDFCCIWFFINMAAVFATLVAFVVAGCVFQWLEPISIGIAVGLAAAVTISIIIWAFVCNGRSGGSCQPILRWIDILDVLTILATILAFLMGVVSPCAIAFWINAGFLQWIRRILQTIAVFTGCLPNPWFRR